MLNKAERHRQHYWEIEEQNKPNSFSLKARRVERSVEVYSKSHLGTVTSDLQLESGFHKKDLSMDVWQ